MRIRQLSFDEAFDEYLIYQIRLSEFVHLFELARQLRTKKIEIAIHMPYTDVMGTVKTASIGWFASLIDRQSAALNIFDVWLALFPHKREDIVAAWADIEPVESVIAAFRNDVAFHANKSLKRYFESREEFSAHKAAITKAMQRFVSFAVEMLREQNTSIPDFNGRLRARLKTVIPDRDVERISKFFMSN